MCWVGLRVQLLLLLRQQTFSEGAYVLFPKKKTLFYTIVVIGLNLSEIGRESVKFRTRRA